MRLLGKGDPLQVCDLDFDNDEDAERDERPRGRTGAKGGEAAAGNERGRRARCCVLR